MDEELAEAMYDVMQSDPNRERAKRFRDRTEPYLKTKDEKEKGERHYYEWLLDEARKLLKKKKKEASPTMPTPGGGGSPKMMPSVPWTAGSHDGSFKDDAICSCPDCRKANK